MHIMHVVIIITACTGRAGFIINHMQRHTETVQAWAAVPNRSSAPSERLWPLSWYDLQPLRAGENVLNLLFLRLNQGDSGVSEGTPLWSEVLSQAWEDLPHFWALGRLSIVRSRYKSQGKPGVSAGAISMQPDGLCAAAALGSDTARARPHFEFHPKYRNFLLGCEVSEMRGQRVDLWSCFFFFFQFAYHLLHLPLLTPEGLRGDFDLNRKSRVVRLRISSSLNSAGKTLAPCLDSQTGFTGGSGLQESWLDLKGVRAFVKSRGLVLWGFDTGYDWS